MFPFELIDELEEEYGLKRGVYRAFGPVLQDIEFKKGKI